MKVKALGMIEVMGYVAAIQVSDCALKSADVNLLGVEKVSSGIVTVKLQGDVSAVVSATESGAEAARQMGKLLTYSVIAKTHEETSKILENKKLENKEVDQQVELQQAEKQHDEGEEVKAVKEQIVEEHEENQSEEQIVKQVEKKTPEEDEKEKQLEKMKVVQLRRMVRNMKIKNFTKEEIKFARKEKLIEEILKYSKEEDK